MTLSSIDNEERGGESTSRRAPSPPAPKAEPADVDGRLDKWRRLLVEDLAELSRRHGRVLFDGEWMSPEEVRRHHRRLRWRNLRLVFEVIVAWLALALMAGVIWMLLGIMGG